MSPEALPISVLPVTVRSVTVAAAGVPVPIAAGSAHVLPSNKEALRLSTTVVEATTSGAVPVETVDTSCVAVVIEPVAVTVAKVAVPVKVGEARLDFVAIATAMLVNSVSISVP